MERRPIYGRKVEDTPNAPILFGWVSSGIGRWIVRWFPYGYRVIVAAWLLRKEGMNNEDIMTVIENRDQAVALADFLWYQKQRHLDDIDQIDRDLKALEEKWAVTPRMKGRM